MTIGIKCCGEYRDTTFCPLCGTKLGESSLAEIASYCRRHERAAMKHTGKLREWCDKHGHEWKFRGVQSTSKRAAKWGRWAAAVEAAMARANGSTKGDQQDGEGTPPV